MPIRQDRASYLLAFLPFTLFFPIGLMYSAFGLFVIAWLAGGNFAAKWERVRSLPMLLPVLAGLVIVLLDAVFCLPKTRAAGLAWSII